MASNDDSLAIAAWNVNGLRSVLRKKALHEFVTGCTPPLDVLCLGETKLSPGDVQSSVDAEVKECIGEYFPHRFYATSRQRKGYSGVAIWCREAPWHVEYPAVQASASSAPSAAAPAAAALLSASATAPPQPRPPRAAATRRRAPR